MESNDLKNSKKKWIALGLLLVILTMTVYVYIHKDEMFSNTVTITYADGCKEYYEDTILVSELCDQGRMLEQNGAIGGNPWIETTNLSFVNLT